MAAFEPSTRGGGGGLSRPTVYTTAEVAERLGVSTDTVERRWRELGGTKLGRRLIFPAGAIDAKTDGVPALHRVLALLPELTVKEHLLVVAQACRLAAEALP